MQEKANVPAIRFAGFTDAWEQRKLGDVAKVYDGVHQTPDYKDSGIMFLSVENIATLKSDKYISEEAFQKDYKVYPQKGDILMTRIGDVGTPNVVETSEKLAFYVSLALLKPNGIDSYFLCNSILSPFFQKGLKDRTLVTAVPQKINKDEIGKVDIFVPKSMPEQAQIGAYFHNLDHLITLHQRKYTRLCNVKKSMLEKMFPRDGASVPEIRFAGFTDAWEQRKFSELFDSLNNNTLSRAELSAENGAARNVHYGDVLIKFGECLRSVAELPYITNESTVQKFMPSKLQNGDIVIADTAEDETVGKCTEILDIEGENVISGLHTIPCRPRQKFAAGYLGYFMNSSAYHDQLRPLMQGIKVTSISKSALQDTILLYPKSTGEQTKIAEMLLALDHLITLHQRELERLQNIKKSCLEKMFV